MSKDFFPPRPESRPTIYAYELVGVPDHAGLLKVGYTTRDAKERVAEQAKTIGVRYRIVFEKSVALELSIIAAKTNGAAESRIFWEQIH